MEAARERVENGDEHLLCLRCTRVGGAGGRELRALAGPTAALAALDPVAVVAVRGERRMDGPLQEVRGAQRLFGIRDSQRGGLLQEALAVALHLVQPRGGGSGRQCAAEGAADRRGDRPAPVLRLAEEVLELVDKRAE